MMTVFEKDGMVSVCDKDEKVESFPIKEFFDRMFSILKEKTIFINNLQDLGLFFIKRLIEEGYSDMSIESSERIEARCFKYIVSSDNHSFYNIAYNYGGNKFTLYEFKNIMSAKMEDVVKDFGGSEVVAMHRACVGMRSFAEKGTTVSSCAYSSWKKGYTKRAFEVLFRECGSEAENICRNAYHGGLCMVGNDIQNKSIKNGIILDVNSLYPFIMKTKRFAIGKETYEVGELPDCVRYNKHCCYYVHFKARFELKKDHIPFARTRCDKRHWQLETLTTSAYIDRYGNRFDYVSCPGNEYIDEWGEIHNDVAPIMVEFCMYGPEFELFFEQYDVFDIQYIDYVWWKNMDNIFSDFVDEFYNMKKNATGRAERRMYKIMLNALSGRMALKTKRKNSIFVQNAQEVIDNLGSSNKIDRSLGTIGKFTDKNFAECLSVLIDQDIDITTRSKSHIQIGAAITSEAMCFIVRKAQANYEHFLYTDTDSLHLDCGLEDVKDCEIGEGIGQFKVEHEFEIACYYGEKTYVIYEKSETGLIPKITWAGMPEDTQKILQAYLYSVSQNKEFQGKDIVSVLNKCSRIDKMYKLAKPENMTEKEWNIFVDNLEAHRCEVNIADAYNKDKNDEKVKKAISNWCSEYGRGKLDLTRKGLYDINLPHIRRVVNSYKNFTFTTKTEWYGIDINLYS